MAYNMKGWGRHSCLPAWINLKKENERNVPEGENK